jgi:plastocyanin
MIGLVRASRAVARTRTAPSRIAAGLAVVALLAALAIAAFGAKPAAAQSGVTVNVGDFFFDSPSLEIAPGTTVTFVNVGAAPHTATGDNGEFDTGTIQPGGSATITFTNAGTFAYHCAIHPAKMTGTIVVTGGGGGAPQVTAMPNTGVGLAFGSSGSTALVAGLLALAGALGLGGITLSRRAAR